MGLNWLDDAVKAGLRAFGDDAVEAYVRQADIGDAVSKYRSQLRKLDTLTGLDAVEEVSPNNPFIKDLNNLIATTLEQKNILKEKVDFAKDLAKVEYDNALAAGLGKNLKRVGNWGRYVAETPFMQDVGRDLLVGTALTGALSVPMLFMNRASSNVPQLTPEQVAALTPEELAQYEQMVRQQAS